MRLIKNAARGEIKIIDNAPFPSTNVDKVSNLLKKCPIASETPLLELEDFLPHGTLWVKDERVAQMPLIKLVTKLRIN